MQNKAYSNQDTCLFIPDWEQKSISSFKKPYEDFLYNYNNILNNLYVNQSNLNINYSNSLVSVLDITESSRTFQKKLDQITLSLFPSRLQKISQCGTQEFVFSEFHQDSENQACSGVLRIPHRCKDLMHIDCVKSRQNQKFTKLFQRFQKLDGKNLKAYFVTLTYSNVKYLHSGISVKCSSSKSLNSCSQFEKSYKLKYNPESSFFKQCSKDRATLLKWIKRNLKKENDGELISGFGVYETPFHLSGEQKKIKKQYIQEWYTQKDCGYHVHQHLVFFVDQKGSKFMNRLVKSKNLCARIGAKMKNQKLKPQHLLSQEWQHITHSDICDIKEVVPTANQSLFMSSMTYLYSYCKKFDYSKTPEAYFHYVFSCQNIKTLFIFGINKKLSLVAPQKPVCKCPLCDYEYKDRPELKKVEKPSVEGLSLKIAEEFVGNPYTLLIHYIMNKSKKENDILNRFGVELVLSAREKGLIYEYKSGEYNIT